MLFFIKNKPTFQKENGSKEKKRKSCRKKENWSSKLPQFYFINSKESSQFVLPADGIIFQYPSDSIWSYKSEAP